MENYRTQFERWMKSERVPAALKAELESADDKTLGEFFAGQMSFGTAGLRAVMRAGSAFMNVITVAHATQALALLIKSENAEERGAVVAYDSRNNSEIFAKTAAGVFAANGIKTYIFDELRPTPLLSFAVRELGCIVGINITASHNPKEYNGYKAYWEDGAQLSPEQARIVAAKMERVDMLDGVSECDFEEAVKDGKITVLGQDFDEKYMAAVLGEIVDKNIIAEQADRLKIVYTPINGAGYRIVPEVLRRAGIKHLSVVESQSMPNGDFPTTPNPNPEYPQTFEEGLPVACKEDAKLIIATDPDADRVGVMVRAGDKDEYVCLTGNQVGALLTDYIITSYEERGCMPDDSYVVKTIVTSEIISKICKTHGVDLCNVLTGFKFIGEVIKNHEKEGKGSFIFGFEESYGYLKGTYARDKDSVVASMLICEMAAYYMKKDMTLYDALQDVYRRYGFYLEGVDSKFYKQPGGTEIMAEKMDALRANAPKTLAGEKIVRLRDYEAGTITDLETGNVTPTGLPKSDVLYYETENGNVTVVRPSGTEPKIKFYYLTHAENKEAAMKIFEGAKADIDARF